MGNVSTNVFTRYLGSYVKCVYDKEKRAALLILSSCMFTHLMEELYFMLSGDVIIGSSAKNPPVGNYGRNLAHGWLAIAF